MGLIQLFTKIGEIVKPYQEDAKKVGYNYNYVNGCTIYGADDHPIDISNPEEAAYKISSKIHEELGWLYCCHNCS